nr:MAG TPA: hypothetical protein [Caudoviricetes sp.]
MNTYLLRCAPCKDNDKHIHKKLIFERIKEEIPK